MERHSTKTSLTLTEICEVADALTFRRRDIEAQISALKRSVFATEGDHLVARLESHAENLKRIEDLLTLPARVEIQSANLSEVVVKDPVCDVRVA